MGVWMGGFPDGWDPEPPDPPVDEHVRFYCDNVAGGCLEAHETAEEAVQAGDTWHPEVYTEWQGTPEMGGPVGFYTDDAYECPGCGETGQEV